MFIELNNMCNISGGVQIPGTCVLIEGCHGADSSFVLHHFVSGYLKSGFNLCFIGLSQSFNHYNSVGIKLGASFIDARENGNLVYIEALKLLGEEILKYESETDMSILQSSKLLHFENNNHSGLKKLYHHCKYCVQDLLTKHPDKPLLLVIDDVSVLRLIGYDSLDVIYFMSYLRALMSTYCGCLVVQTLCDTTGEDQDKDPAVQHIHHQSECFIKVEALSSGYCKDVHGQVSLKYLCFDYFHLSKSK